MAEGRRKRGAGCLLAFTYWVVLSLAVYVVSIGEPVTADFATRDLRMFSIARIDRSGGEPDYRRITLETYLEGGADTAGRDYRLPLPEVRLDYGDIDVIRVIEDNGVSQLIEYHHNNSAYIKSIYRAAETGIEPVSVQVVSNVGVGFGMMLAVFPAWLLAWLTAFLWRRRRGARAVD